MLWLSESCHLGLVSMETRYGHGRSEHRISLRVKFTVPVQNYPATHLFSCTMDTMYLPEVKQPERGPEHPPSSSPEFAKGLEPHLRFLFVPVSTRNRAIITSLYRQVGTGLLGRYVVGPKSFRPDQLFKVTEIKQFCYFST